MNNKISIIIPIYNAELYLNRCLDSVLKQKYDNFECILINDGSTDSSGEICEKYCDMDDRFIVIHQENKGVSCARNTGLKISKGDWISFIDSDDWVDESIYIDCMGNKNISDINIFQYGYYKCLENNEKRYYGITEEYHNSYYIPPMYHGCWSRLFRKQLIDECKLTFKDNCSMAEDLLFSLSCILNSDGKVCNINKGLYNYFENKNGAVSNFSKRKINDEIDAVKEIESLYKAKRITDETSLIKYKEEAKLKFLVSLNRTDIKSWITTFPEINTYLYKPHFSKYWILYILCKYRLSFIIEIMVKLKRKFKRLLK